MSESSETKAFCWLRTHPRVPATFFSSVLFGLAAHGMGLFNKLSSHDDLVSLFELGTTISSGRWMLHVMDWLETGIFGPGHFSLPLTHGLFSILCIAFAACLLVELLQIRSLIYCVGLAGIMVTFPAVTGLFGYMYTMPYYMTAMLMTVVSAWLICRKTPWWAKAASLILGGCAVGVYQAFFPLLVSIPLLYDLMLFSREETDLKSFFQLAALLMLCVVGTMVFYFTVNRFFLAKFGLELNRYMGIDQMESTSLAVYLQRAGKAYREFFQPERNVPADIFPMHLFYMSRLMVAADAVLAVRLAIRIGRNHRGKAAAAVLLLALMPMACNLIYVMSGTVHGLMTYGQVMQAGLFVWLADRTEMRRPAIRRIISGAAAGVLGLSCVMYVRYDNQCYLKAVFQQQQAVTWFTALAAQIKSAEGYRDDLPVVFLNQEEISDQSVYQMDELNFILLTPYDKESTEYLNSYAWRKMMERWCGFSPAYANEADYADLPEVKAMPHYPDDGSIRNLGDVIVVNF